uniref:Uncharacterized protein n=1 Tax=Anguilla anguilla TaxID=7936 RepID=A0A0E9WXD9_ANGAN
MLTEISQFITCDCEMKKAPCLQSVNWSVQHKCLVLVLVLAWKSTFLIAASP